MTKGEYDRHRHRRPMSKEIKDTIKGNGETAINRMAELLQIDELFHRMEANDEGEVELVKGSFSPKDQMQLLSVAMERHLGKPTDLTVSHQHSGMGGVQAQGSNRLRDLSDRLPERTSQERVIDAKVVELSDDKEAKPERARMRRRRGK